MILNHEDLSAIEASFGPEKAAPLINALEKLEREQKLEIKKDLLMELATKADVADVKTDIARLEGKIDRINAELKGEIKRVEVEIKVLLKVLIALSIIAIGLFSPAGVELIKLIR